MPGCGCMCVTPHALSFTLLGVSGKGRPPLSACVCLCERESERACVSREGVVRQVDMFCCI